MYKMQSIKITNSLIHNLHGVVYIYPYHQSSYLFGEVVFFMLHPSLITKELQYVDMNNEACNLYTVDVPPGDIRRIQIEYHIAAWWY